MVFTKKEKKKNKGREILYFSCCNIYDLIHEIMFVYCIVMYSSVYCSLCDTTQTYYRLTYRSEV